MNKRRRIENGTPSNVPEYMLTYGDMMTLLLCFFVLLFAFSEIDAQKFEAIMQSFKGSAGILPGGRALETEQFILNSSIEDNIAKIKAEIEDFNKLKRIVEEYLSTNNLSNEIIVGIEERGLLLRFKENVLFDSGKADIKKEAKETLYFISKLLSQEEFKDKYVRVEGHTDTDPISNFRFPSNWELSAIRASNVVRFFIEEASLEPYRFSASGYGEYHPVAPNDTSENKAKNRRVDIVILRNNEL